MPSFQLPLLLKGCLLAGIAAFAWGSQSYVTRLLFGECMEEFEPSCVAFCRFFSGTVFLLIWQECTTNDLPILLSAVKKEWKNFLFLGGDRFRASFPAGMRPPDIFQQGPLGHSAISPFFGQCFFPLQDLKKRSLLPFLPPLS